MEARLQFWNGNPRGLKPSFFEKKMARSALHFLKEILVARTLRFWTEIIDSPAAVAFIFCWKLDALHWLLNGNY